MISRVKLGASGLEVSRLCIGTGTGGWNGVSNQTKLGHQQLVTLLCQAYDAGITIWDSADQYGSHPHVRDALRVVGRENVVVTTKTCAREADQAVADVARYRRELGVEALDLLLLHCLLDPEWPETYAPVLEALTAEKEAGNIRVLGVSCHNFGAFQTAAVTDWVEVVLARINHSSLNMDADKDEVVPLMRRMHDRGIGIYGMKVLGQGKLGADPEQAIRYVLGLGCVDAITIGMESVDEVRQNVALVERIDAEFAVRV